jgi:hypothetical protein
MNKINRFKLGFPLPLRNNYNDMTKKSLFAILGLVTVIALIYFLKPVSTPPKNEKEVGLIVLKHTEAFNLSVNAAVDQYLNIKNAFVDADTIKVNKHTSAFILALDAIDTLELKKENPLIFETFTITKNDIKLNALSLLSQTDITEKRKDFNNITSLMYPSFFKTIGYEGPTLYLQECPMAFYDTIAANWISNSAEIVNPYLGKNHPIYKAGMLHCGELKDSINSK